jgi:two-component system, OmpR family, response regulator
MKHVLVIDDDPSVAQLVSAALSARGVQHQLSYCQDGGQGRMAAVQGRHDLVVLDLVMPVVGGIEALAAIRRGPRSAHTPVLVLTGNDDLGTRRYVEEMGITAFVLKPVSAQELGDLMCEALGEPDAPRPTSH